MKPIFKMVEVQPYQFSRLVEVVVADVYPIFSHPLEGLFVHQDGERDKVLIGTSHHWNLEKSGVEISHVRNGGSLWLKGAHWSIID